MTISVEKALADGANAFARISETAKLDAQVLLLDVLDKPRSYLFTWPDSLLTFEQLQQFDTYLQRRLAG